MDTMHLKYPLVHFGSEGSAPTLPLFLLLPRNIMLFHCFSTMTKDHLLIILNGTKWPSCADVPLNPHIFNRVSLHTISARLPPLVMNSMPFMLNKQYISA